MRILFWLTLAIIVAGIGVALVLGALGQ